METCSIAGCVSLRDVRETQDFGCMRSLCGGFILSICFITHLLYSMSIPTTIFPPVFIGDEFVCYWLSKLRPFHYSLSVKSGGLSSNRGQFSYQRVKTSVPKGMTRTAIWVEGAATLG